MYTIENAVLCELQRCNVGVVALRIFHIIDNFVSPRRHAPDTPKSKIRSGTDGRKCVIAAKARLIGDKKLIIAPT